MALGANTVPSYGLEVPVEASVKRNIALQMVVYVYRQRA